MNNVCHEQHKDDKQHNYLWWKRNIKENDYQFSMDYLRVECTN